MTLHIAAPWITPGKIEFTGYGYVRAVPLNSF